MKQASVQTGILLFLTIIFSIACTNPARHIDITADELGYTRQILSGVPFRHVTYRKPRMVLAGTTELHIYIEGDGSPWHGHDRVAGDPTPRNPLMLRLMASDPRPSLYLGRPCYFGLASEPPCTPEFWTHARYSRAVVASMAIALKRFLADQEMPKLTFIGHSGGGTLAFLLAREFASTQAVITLAGNLDPDAWTEKHGYTRLYDSLNPAHLPPLAPSIRQWHYLGQQDDEIPPETVSKFALAHPATKIIPLDNIAHSCCWEAIWPSILKDLIR